ncbi:MAG: carbohydrate kinase family protein [Gaiellaceae bacterium]
MSQLAIVGLTARDRIDGGAPSIGGAPYFGVQALREVGASTLAVTKLAERDVALLEPLASKPEELVWRASSETAAYTLTHDPTGGERRVTIDSLGEPWNADRDEAWVLPALAGRAAVHAGALSAADFPADWLALLARGRRLSFDGQGLVRPSRIGPVTLEFPDSLDALEHVDVLKLSAEEAEVLGIEPTPESMRGLTVPEVVLTAGADGAWIYADGALAEIEVEPTAVTDTTGAGDGFIACYLHARIEGASGADAGAFAARAVAAMLQKRVVHGH